MPCIMGGSSLFMMGKWHTEPVQGLHHGSELIVNDGRVTQDQSNAMQGRELVIHDGRGNIGPVARHASREGAHS